MGLISLPCRRAAGRRLDPPAPRLAVHVEPRVSEQDRCVLSLLVDEVAREGMLVAEIGSFLGDGSTRTLAGKLRPLGGLLYCVDTWQGNQNVEWHQQLARDFDLFATFRDHVHRFEARMSHTIRCAVVWLLIGTCTPLVAAEHLVSNRFLLAKNATAVAPDGFAVSGDAVYGVLGFTEIERSGRGVRLQSGKDRNRDGKFAGAVSTTVKGITAKHGRWYRLRIRGLAQPGFHVRRENLYLKVEFYKANGRDSLDHIRKSFYAQVERERADLKDSGTNRVLGSAVWRSYSLEFRTPFPEVDTLRLSAGFADGTGKRRDSEFWINEFDLTPIPDPADYKPRTSRGKAVQGSLDSFVKLGGRWYYDPRGGERRVPKQFDRTNADRLIYRSDRLEAPFAGNMTSWLKAGYLDYSGKLVKKTRPVADNLVIRVTKTHLVVMTKNLPNHPTAVFPDRWRYLDGNPNYIREQRLTFYLPLIPKVNAKHIAMTKNNGNRALRGGPIGIATNGVVFFNPFDESNEIDAVWRLDRCCGHPAPNSIYHYHKYPVCVKSPWTDDGTAHSPVIGFAFDGFPVYGPYESSGVLAKDVKANRLNAFNVHFDKQRGWHYHVTPGRFPHIIGGYWGQVDERNRPRRRPRRRRKVDNPP